MKTNRVWIEIVLLGTGIACALALLFATVGAAAGVAVGEVSVAQQAPATTNQTYEGMVTCSRCGAKHSAVLGQTATNCVRACVHGGANFMLVDADVTYLLDGDLNVLKKLAGERVRVVGALQGKRIKISSLASEMPTATPSW
jgi:hypothetical protein